MTIYLDCNATTPVLPEVVDQLRRFLETEIGNAGSRTHDFGRRASLAVEEARRAVAQTVLAKPEEVVFTGGATEANNIALLGLESEGRASGRMHIVSCRTEHKAVLEPLAELVRRGFEVTLLQPGASGYVEPFDLGAALRKDTLLVSLMHVNNETGTVQPLASYCDVLGKHSAFFHTDASQGWGKIDGLTSSRIDMISISGHKSGAPQGVGALVARRRGWVPLPLKPIMHGGMQERGLRPGTLPVGLVAALGLAASISGASLARNYERALRIRDRVILELRGVARPNVPLNVCSPYCVNVRFVGCDAEALMLAAKDVVAVSSGSACTSQLHASSHVLLALGMTPDEVSESIRISWSTRSDEDDVVRGVRARGRGPPPTPVPHNSPTFRIDAKRLRIRSCWILSSRSSSARNVLILWAL